MLNWSLPLLNQNASHSKLRLAKSNYYLRTYGLSLSYFILSGVVGALAIRCGPCVCFPSLSQHQTCCHSNNGILKTLAQLRKFETTKMLPWGEPTTHPYSTPLFVQKDPFFVLLSLTTELI